MVVMYFSGAHEVLRDVFQYIRELVSENALMNRMRETVVEKLKAGQEAAAEFVDKQTTAAANQVNGYKL